MNESIKLYNFLLIVTNNTCFLAFIDCHLVCKVTDHIISCCTSQPVKQAQEKDDETNLQKAFIIVAVVLAIFCLVLAIVLFNTVRRSVSLCTCLFSFAGCLRACALVCLLHVCLAGCLPLLLSVDLKLRMVSV